MDLTALQAGLVRVAACSLPVHLAEPQANAAAIAAQAKAAAASGASLVVFPELSLSGYSLDDLFMQNSLLAGVENAATMLTAATADLPAVLVVGAPLRAGHRLYNCALVIAAGRIWGAVPKSYLPNYREFYEHRQFASGIGLHQRISFAGQEFTVTTQQLFTVAVVSDRVSVAALAATGATTADAVALSNGTAPADAISASGPAAPAPNVTRPTAFTFGIEICEDLWVPLTPGAEAALAGAEVIVNLSGSPITVGKARQRQRLVEAQSSKLICGYVYAASGAGESSTDLSWDGQTLVFERGELLAQGPRFATEPITTLTELDVALIRQDRLRQGTFDDNRRAALGPIHPVWGENTLLMPSVASPDGIDSPDGIGRGLTPGYQAVPIVLPPVPAIPTAATSGETPTAPTVPAPTSPPNQTKTVLAPKLLLRPLARFPFVPNDPKRLDQDCYEAYSIQVSALQQRLRSIGEPKIVIGVSGGLDSTQALIVAAKALDQLGRPRRDILAFTLPGFGTTQHTRDNAEALARALNVTFEELDIKPAAAAMLRDLGHPYADGEPVFDITFENVQAGLRTDYLFRLANQRGGIVLGTGDLSELALGWCTYGVGDQMSHYNVNAGVPKTLIQHLIRWVIASQQFDAATANVLQRIVETEISPELVPPGADGAIQSTQATIGPYALHDFLLYYTLRFGLSPREVFFRLRQAWEDPERGEWPAAVPAAERCGYTPAEILRWMRVFYQRFLAAQFKRSALPNGPKVVAGGALSPRGDWRQPSDAAAKLWLAELALLDH
ncbi:MAG: NAD(+) synthase [Bifidobacteriaceae bacterium]|nr:NAD(+) synthase [Bifidobacteriaceae bacterium]